MKTIIVFLLFLFVSPDKNDCMLFYEKTLPEEISALVENKQEGNEYYILSVKKKTDGEVLKLLFLKNVTGKEIYDFIKIGSHIKKRKGQLQISALTPTNDGGFRGQLFPDLCK